MGVLGATLLVCGVALAASSDVVDLTGANFAQHIKDHRQTLVEFYAPWCGHCKKLEPEYEKAAATLKAKGVPLAKVDATADKDVASKHGVKGYPTFVWFEDGQAQEFDGGRTSEGIVDWVVSMLGAAVTETAFAPAPNAEKPLVVLHAESLLPGFDEAAKANRRKAAWYFVRVSGFQKVVLTHQGEEPVELLAGCGDKDKVTSFLNDNIMPLFGVLEGSTFDRYMEAGKGIVWSLFPPESEGLFEAVHQKHKAMMTQVAKRFKGKYFVTITDVEKHKEAVEGTLGVTEFPAIAVQRKAGDKKRYVYNGQMAAADIIKFIDEVEDGFVAPKWRTEEAPASNDGPVRKVVGTTLQQELFRPDKDVLLEVYAPWCGHCKKLDPEYEKLARKIQKEELTDLLVIGKIDGVANDSPIESVDWTTFPTIYFAKAATNAVVAYDGERTAKGLWKYIKKHATKAAEIRERVERRKNAEKKGAEL